MLVNSLISIKIHPPDISQLAQTAFSSSLGFGSLEPLFVFPFVKKHPGLSHTCMLHMLHLLLWTEYFFSFPSHRRRRRPSPALWTVSGHFVSPFYLNLIICSRSFHLFRLKSKEKSRTRYTLKSDGRQALPLLSSNKGWICSCVLCVKF